MDVAGDLQHTYNEGKSILDAELSTYLDEQMERYKLNAYWRAGALVELLVGPLITFLSIE